MKRKNKKQRKLRKCEQGITTKSLFYMQRHKDDVKPEEFSIKRMLELLKGK